MLQPLRPKPFSACLHTAEAPGRSGRSSNSQVAANGKDQNTADSPADPTARSVSVSIDEESEQQMEKLLATMRLQVEQSKLHKSSIGTVVAQSANAVGPVLFLEVQIEGCPVKAVVDTGVQSTILSRETLHRVAKCM